MRGYRPHHQGGYPSKARHRKPRRSYYSLAERGWIQLLVLRILHEESMHGYQLIDELEERQFVESGRFKTGSIYTILNRLEKRGSLASEKVETTSGRIRRVYRITTEGESTLREGLKSLIPRKKISDELVDYYEDKFGTEQTDIGESTDLENQRT